MSGLGIDTLLSIPEAAELAKVPERTMRRRLLQLDAKLRAEGRRGILERPGEHWKVRLEALHAELRTAELAEQLGGRVESLESRVEDISLKQIALRDSVQAERRRQSRRWEAQEKVNAGLRQALLGMSELADERVPENR
jgi:hypothetical protein